MNFFRRYFRVAICVLLGGFEPTAHAQSSVTLYGVVDAGILYTSKTLDLTTGQNAGHQFSLISGGMTPSLFGFKGSEDLGGGTRAIFTLESGINLANGGFSDSNGNFFGRQAFVGIQSDYGTVRAGLQFSPFLLSLVSSEVRGSSYFGSVVPIYVDNVFVTGGYNSNAISYESPTVAGFQGNAMLALGGIAGDFQAGRQYSFSLNYTDGPVMVTAAMYSGNGGGTAATTPVPSTVPFFGRTIGASYSFEKLTLRAVFVNYRVSGSFDSRVYGGGFNYRITPATYVDAGVWYTSDGNDTRNHSILAATGLTYNLSLATSLYAQFAFVNNHGKMDTGVSGNGATFGAPGATFGATVGMRHLF
ncbi:porin [Paraburkholderia oxyphila]|uniref:porin n=1 Tax=Paraburkholderia oxyphila TaxID=614212 RepID=UPI000A073F21|nr:porin [Paraburkholderia oxyphila]